MLVGSIGDNYLDEKQRRRCEVITRLIAPKASRQRSGLLLIETRKEPRTRCLHAGTILLGRLLYAKSYRLWNMQSAKPGRKLELPLVKDRDSEVTCRA